MGALRCAYSITAAASLVSRTTSTSWIGCCAVHAPGTADCLYDLALAKHSGAFVRISNFRRILCSVIFQLTKFDKLKTRNELCEAVAAEL
jgi:hypothetical protein